MLYIINDTYNISQYNPSNYGGERSNCVGDEVTKTHESTGEVRRYVYMIHLQEVQSHHQTEHPLLKQKQKPNFSLCHLNLKDSIFL